MSSEADLRRTIARLIDNERMNFSRLGSLLAQEFPDWKIYSNGKNLLKLCQELQVELAGIDIEYEGPGERRPLYISRGSFYWGIPDDDDDDDDDDHDHFIDEDEEPDEELAEFVMDLVQASPYEPLEQYLVEEQILIAFGPEWKEMFSVCCLYDFLDAMASHGYPVVVTDDHVAIDEEDYDYYDDDDEYDDDDDDGHHHDCIHDDTIAKAVLFTLPFSGEPMALDAIAASIVSVHGRQWRTKTSRPNLTVVLRELQTVGLITFFPGLRAQLIVSSAVSRASGAPPFVSRHSQAPVVVKEALAWNKVMDTNEIAALLVRRFGKDFKNPGYGFQEATVSDFMRAMAWAKPRPVTQAEIDLWGEELAKLRVPAFCFVPPAPSATNNTTPAITTPAITTSSPSSSASDPLHSSEIFASYSKTLSTLPGLKSTSSSKESVIRACQKMRELMPFMTLLGASGQITSSDFGDVEIQMARTICNFFRLPENSFGFPLVVIIMVSFGFFTARGAPSSIAASELAKVLNKAGVDLKGYLSSRQTLAGYIWANFGGMVNRTVTQGNVFFSATGDALPAILNLALGGKLELTEAAENKPAAPPATTLECPICLSEDLKPGTQGASNLKCGHLFHSVCLVRWTESNPNCPVCRAKI